MSKRLTAEELIRQFAEGATIATAASVYSNLSDKDKKSKQDLFIAAALVPRHIIVVNDLDSALKKAGYKISGDLYNHSIARIIGCMLLEAN
jgi:hypothetical protein